MDHISIISNARLNRMLDEDKILRINYEGDREVEGMLYDIWSDKISGKLYAVRKIRSVDMGFNSNEPGKEEEFVEIVEREGACKASWGVTGRTMHKMLAMQLAKKYPQYRFEIGDNYECTAYLKEDKCE